MPSAAVPPLRVLVAGGGVAALEVLLALQALAAERVRIVLLAPDRHFTDRPIAVTAPFSPAPVLRVALADIGADRGVRVHRDALARVRLDDRVVETQGGAELGYDVLVLALGARMREGVRGALTFRGAQDALRVRAVVDALHAGTIDRVAFVVPTGTAWALPIYELALQTAAFLEGSASGARLSVITPEQAPLEVFGAATSAMVEALLAGRGIALRTGARVEEVVDGALWLDGRPEAFDRVIALPSLSGPRPRGVPCDPLGFIPVDDFMRVLDTDALYAVGDNAANGLKQGGLATQQADAAAGSIAARAGAPVDAEPFHAVLHGLLVTGDGLDRPSAKPSGRHLAPYLASMATAGR